MRFQMLERVMLKTGFSKEVTAIAMEWLDISKDRDMDLFDKMTVQNNKFKREEIYYYHEAFKQDVVPIGSEELYRRIILMSYKLLDSEAYLLTNQLAIAIPDMSDNDISKLAANTMQEVYGNEAQARTLAVRYCKYSRQGWILNATFPVKSEPYLKAAELTSNEDSVIKLMLCANALEYMPLTYGKKMSDEAMRAVELIKDIMKSDIAEDDLLLCIALAPASFFDEQLRQHFQKYAKDKAIDICKHVFGYMTRPNRTMEALFSVEGTFTPAVLNTILGIQPDHKILLQVAAKMQTETFKNFMCQKNSVKDMTEMNNALKAVKPDEVMGEDAYKIIAKQKTAEVVASCFQEKDKIKAYISGKTTFDEVWPIIKSTKLGCENSAECNYLKNCGEDDFIIRCIVVLGGSGGSYSTHLRDIAGYDEKHKIKNLVDKMLIVGVNIVQALDICGNMLEQRFLYSVSEKDCIENFSRHIEDIAAEDITKCNATAKNIALTLFKNDEKKYHSQIMALAGDTAKAVRDAVAEIAIKHPDWNDDIIVLLKSKKSSERDFALTIIEKQGAKEYIPELKKALADEKTDKMKARIGSILATVSEAGNSADKVSAADIVKNMTGGKKTAKLEWLFKKPFTPVHLKDGSVADESYIKALMLCFVNSVGLKDPNADVIASDLVPEDVCRLANEVLDRWLTTPPDVKSEWMKFYEEYEHEYGNTVHAQAKYKWTIYFASVYGGKKAMDMLDALMDHWPLMQKGALAKEIPYAMILNGSSEYIMKVEKMSRKHRFNSIRKASADALLSAAEKLGISKEEFADRMVPDMDFDENMCRTFDYGSRQFKVYISSKLDLEVYCNEKKLKSMPKPSESDDKARADAAYKEFTAMKKLMKTVVATQLERLEKTMCTARSWTSQNWKKLFVSNPIMHRFAMGLIWGIYKDNKLEKSFRYMEDGSFNTVDDEEFIIPEIAQIGLVHPIELSDKDLSTWKQQLKDYDIIQPFAQLDRSIFKPTDEEKCKDCIERFKGQIRKNIDLASAMNKIGWNKGVVGDGAMIDDFFREDNLTRNNGIKASLVHSGMSIDIYRGEEVNVTIGELYFYKLPTGGRMTIADLRDRYFSEILYQLSTAFA